MIKNVTRVGGVVLILTRSVAAHPAHGIDGGSYSLGHYLSEPLHVLTGVAVLIGVSAALNLLRRGRFRLSSRRPQE